MTGSGQRLFIHSMQWLQAWQVTAHRLEPIQATNGVKQHEQQGRQRRALGAPQPDSLRLQASTTLRN